MKLARFRSHVKEYRKYSDKPKNTRFFKSGKTMEEKSEVAIAKAA